MHFFQIEQAHFESFNRVLYRTRPEEIEGLLVQQKAAAPGPLPDDVVVCFAIAYARIGVFDKTAAVAKHILFQSPPQPIDREKLRDLAYGVDQSLNSEQAEEILTDLRPLFVEPWAEELEKLFAADSTAKLHVNWYVYAWYEYQSALTIAFELLRRAVVANDAASLGRCFSYFGLSCSLSGIYGLGRKFANLGAVLTAAMPETSFRVYWCAEADAISATAEFYANRFKDCLATSHRVFTDYGAVPDFPFAHIYTCTILMRAAIEEADFTTFRSMTDRLKLLLGQQFDSRYSVQSHYLMGLFKLLQGMREEGMRHFVVARAELSKEENTFRSINHCHCLSYEARIKMLLGDYRGAYRDAQAAFDTMPSGSIDGRHAIEILLVLWRSHMLSTSKLFSGAKEPLALDPALKNEIWQRCRDSWSFKRRFALYDQMERAAVADDRRGFLDAMGRLRKIAPMDHAEIADVYANQQFQDHIGSKLTANVDTHAASLRYLEDVSSWVGSLASVSSYSTESIDQCLLSIAKLFEGILGSKSQICDSDEPFEDRRLHVNKNGIQQVFAGPDGCLPVAVTFKLGDRQTTLVYRQTQYQLSFERSVLEALVLAKTSLESHFRTLNLLKQREEEAHLLSVAKTTAMLAHDVRGPFATLRTILDLLPTMGHDLDWIAKATSQLEKKISNVNDMIDDILDVTRPVELKAKPYYGDRLIADSLNLAFQSWSETKPIQLRYDIDTRKPLIVDLEKMKRVISNIVSNAAYVAEPGSVITIEISTTDYGSVINIHNTGSSIPEEALGRIFESFYTKRRGGSGLGLAIAKRLVLAHQGTISARNERNGVSFTITLQQTDADGDAHGDLPYRKVTLPGAILDIRTGMEGPIRGERTKSRRKVEHPVQLLVLDDDEVYGQHIAQLAGELATEIALTAVSSYDEAVKAIETEVFSHAIVDIDLGSALNGLDFIELLNRVSSSTRVMVHSSRKWTNCQSVLHNLNVAAISDKPLTKANLYTFLAEITQKPLRFRMTDYAVNSPLSPDELRHGQ